MRINKFCKARWLAPALLLLAGATAAAAVTDYPYTPPFKQNVADGWTTYKGGAGSWSNGSDGFWQASVGSGLSNAWLFSPELQMRSGYKYTVSYTVEVGSDNYPKEINQTYLLASPSSSAEVVFEGNRTQNSASEKVISTSFVYENTEDRSVYFAIKHLTNGSDQGWKTNLKNFTITEEANVMQPNPVTDLTATPAADGSRSVTLAWVNPSTYNFGDPLTIASIEVKRGETTVATVTDAARLAGGAEVCITDNFDVSGKYTYTVTVRDAEGLEASKSVTTPYVGPVAPVAPTYDYAFDDPDENGFWSIVNYPAEGADAYTGKSWTITPPALLCDLSGSVTNDSWAFSRPLTLEAGKAYTLTVKHRVDNRSNPFPLAIGLATAQSKESVVKELLNDAAYQLDVAYTDVNRTIGFSVDESGTYYVGINSFGKLSSANYSNKMTIKQVKVEQVPVRPVAVADLTLTDAADNAIATTLAWTMPAVSETGIALGTLRADIYRDGAKVSSAEGNAGERLSLRDTADNGLTPGYHAYYVTAVNTDGGESDPSETVSTGFLGGAIPLPFTSDFAEASGLWTVIDNSTLGGKAFEFTETGHAVLDEGSGNKTRLNDWLVTPLLAMEAGKSYEVTVTAKSVTTSTYSGVNITPDFHLGTSNTVESMAEQKTNLAFGNTAVETKRFVVTPENEGGATIGMHVTSPSANAWGIDVTSVSVALLCQRPQAVTAAKALAAESGNSVTISCTMPTKNDYALDLDPSTVMTLTIAREGGDTPLTTLTGLAPGQEVSWTDAEAADGFNTYVLTPAITGDAEHPGGEGQPLAVMSDYVGEGRTLPYVADFADNGAEWLQISERGTAQYEFGVEGHEASAYLLAGANEDASATYLNWLITPALNLKAGKAYNLKFTARSKPRSSGYAIDYSVYVAKVPTVADLKAGKKISAASAKVTESTLTERSIDFFVEEDGKYFIGYMVDASTDSSVSEVGAWSVTCEQLLPAAPTSVSGSLTADRTVDVTFLAPSKTTMGNALGAEIEARVYRDGEETPCLVQTVESGKTTTVSLTDADSRYHAYKLAVAIPDEGESTRVTVGTFFTGTPLATPYASDFAAKPYEWKTTNSSMGDTQVVVDESGVTASSTDTSSSNVKVYAYTPLMTLDAAKAYRLQAKVASTGTASTFKVTLTPESGDPVILGKDIKPARGSLDLSYDFKPKASGVYSVAFYMERGYYNSDALNLSDVTLAEVASTPAAPTAVSAVEDEGELDLIFSVTLPTLGSLGETLPADAAMTAAVYVNGDKHTETDPAAPGETVEISVTVPTNGIHTLSATAILGDNESAPAEMRTDWVGAGLTVSDGNPYEPTMDTDGLEGYTTWKEGTYTGWNIGTLGLQVDARDGEYWLFTTPFKFHPELNYQVSFDHQMQTGTAGQLEVFIGAQPNVAAMATAVGDPIAVTSTKTAYTQTFNSLGSVVIEDPDEEENEDPAPAGRPARVAPDGSRTYIGIKATGLTHSSTWTNPRLVLDNLRVAFHSVPTSVDEMEADGIRLQGRTLTLGAPADIRAYTPDGRLELQARRATTLDLSRLPAGPHIITVTTDGETRTLKLTL